MWYMDCGSALISYSHSLILYLGEKDNLYFCTYHKMCIRDSNYKGGGSTITQQLIKNNVLKGGNEKSFGAKMERKIQEQYLALQLTKSMDRKLIITNYLNTINLGNNSLGVKVASRRYFNKEVSDLTLSECAVLAGITQNPSKFNPISGREENEKKRKIILQYMVDQELISKEEQEEACLLYTSRCV